MKKSMKRGMIQKKLYAAVFLMLLMCMMAALGAWPAYADEDDDHTQHTWVENYDEYEEYTDTQHKHIITYYCEGCDEEKTETLYEGHDYKERSGYDEYEEYTDTQHKRIITYDCEVCGAEKTETVIENHSLKKTESSDYKSVSAAKHSYTEEYYCSKCDTYVKKSKTAAHNFNKYGICKDCEYVKSQEIKLATGKTAYINAKTWIKIAVKKNGYLILTDTSGNGCNLNLYDKSKRLYSDTFIYVPKKGYKAIECDAENYVAVTKGTWYLKLPDDVNVGSAIKYSFKAVPSASNITKKKATTLKKGKTVTGVIYSSAKKNTWTRYYKVKLSKKQMLKFAFDGSYGGSINVTNSKGEFISYKALFKSKYVPTGWYTSYNKLPKGTYYIGISSSWTSSSKKKSTGNCFRLKWS